MEKIKKCCGEIRHAVVNIQIELKLYAKGKRTNSQTLINIAKESKRASDNLKELEKNGL
jgi:hypothetical protein